MKKIYFLFMILAMSMALAENDMKFFAEVGDVQLNTEFEITIKGTLTGGAVGPAGAIVGINDIGVDVTSEDLTFSSFSGTSASPIAVINVPIGNGYTLSGFDAAATYQDQEFILGTIKATVTEAGTYTINLANGKAQIDPFLAAVSYEALTIIVGDCKVDNSCGSGDACDNNLNCWGEGEICKEGICGQYDAYVKIESVGTGFISQNTEVPVGGYVIWENKDATVHTVKFGDDESSNLQTDDIYTKKFDSVGAFSYVCGIHPSMEGTICVGLDHQTNAEHCGTCGNACADGMTCSGGICSDGAPVCGDGVIEDPEQCDDGNTADGDGCSAACTTEATTVKCCVVQGPPKTCSVIIEDSSCAAGGTLASVDDNAACSALCAIQEDTQFIKDMKAFEADAANKAEIDKAMAKQPSTFFQKIANFFKGLFGIS